MNKLTLTNHAETRLRQRGMLETDLQLITQFGTSVGDAIFMRTKDIQKGIEGLKRIIQRLEHLKGRTLIMNGDTVITAYKATRKHEKKIIRNTRKEGIHHAN